LHAPETKGMVSGSATGPGKEFEWENKRERTLLNRGLDFQDVVPIFDAPHVIIDSRSEIEQRFGAVGEVQGHVVTVFFTDRGDRVRIISARRARRHERDHYLSIHPS